MPAGVLLHGAEEGWGLYLKRSEERPHDGSSWRRCQQKFLPFAGLKTGVYSSPLFHAWLTSARSVGTKHSASAGWADTDERLL